MTEIGLLLFPKLTQLDLTGPLEPLSRLSDSRVHLIWKTLDPVASDRGLALLPTTTLETCPALDVILVPGGAGQIELMDDLPVLEFLARQAAGAKYVASVCTGSLVLGAAGLLRGYRATTHWMSLPELPFLGAIPVSERVVIDRNRVTGAGVSAGLDLGLTLAALLRGDREASAIQLGMEYDPQPPFRPAPDLKALLTSRMQPLLARRHEATLRAQARLAQ